MSSLDLIRSLRHAMTALRDAPDPEGVQVVAIALRSEIDDLLGEHDTHLAHALQSCIAGTMAEPLVAAEQLDVLAPREIGMAVEA